MICALPINIMPEVVTSLTLSTHSININIQRVDSYTLVQYSIQMPSERRFRADSGQHIGK